MTPEGRAGLSISEFQKPIRVKPAPTNQLVPFVSNANPIGIRIKASLLVGERFGERSECTASNREPL
jgi:hypothetical protein